ncbi:MAG: SOS response-associated peptidase [Anaerolineales bacterium]|nr:SOS response-associated peptidase [Anaerolineales bacterium]
MCGRYTQTVTDPQLLAQTFHLENTPSGLAPRYNIAPSQSVATIVKDEANRNRLAMMRWGLIPSWAKDATVGNRMINARAETLAEKPSFRAAFRSRRCLVVADGFYEWKTNDDGSKTPIYIRLKDGSIFGMAGLWEQWKDPATGELITSCTIITTDPNELIKPLHHRMAVIMPQADYEQWLDPRQTDTQQLEPLLRPYTAAEMTAYPVSTRVNNAKYDGPDLIDPLVE